MNIAPKTAAAVSGGSISVALVTIMDWILGFWHVSLNASVGAAFATVFAGLGAYLAPRNHPAEDQPQPPS